jgi:hypothetical protein
LFCRAIHLEVSETLKTDFQCVIVELICLCIAGADLRKCLDKMKLNITSIVFSHFLLIYKSTEINRTDIWLRNQQCCRSLWYSLLLISQYAFSHVTALPAIHFLTWYLHVRNVLSRFFLFFHVPLNRFKFPELAQTLHEIAPYIYSMPPAPSFYRFRFLRCVCCRNSLFCCF